jgi:hypothetical protein
MYSLRLSEAWEKNYIEGVTCCAQAYTLSFFTALRAPSFLHNIYNIHHIPSRQPVQALTEGTTLALQ